MIYFNIQAGFSISGKPVNTAFILFLDKFPCIFPEVRPELFNERPLAV